LSKKSLEAATALTTEFGTLNKVTGQNIAASAKLMTYYNLTAQEAAEWARITADNAKSMTLMVEELSNIRDVAPTVVFKDLASNAEEFAK